MYCKNCGGRIEDGQKFCTYCGSKVDESSENKESNNNQSGPYISYESLTGHSADEPHTSLTGKSRVFAGLMAILLGAGIHNFYLGYNKKAVAQLLIYILSTVLLYAAQSSDCILAAWCKGAAFGNIQKINGRTGDRIQGFPIPLC